MTSSYIGSKIGHPDVIRVAFYFTGKEDENEKKAFEEEIEEESGGNARKDREDLHTQV